MFEQQNDIQAMLAWQQQKEKLPVLTRRAGDLRQRLQELAGLLKEQEEAVSGEQQDVDRLQNQTIGNYLLNLSRLMDRRLQKEEQELIQAKRRLDETMQEQRYLQQELLELERQIAGAQDAGRQWDLGMRARLDWLAMPANQAADEAYQAVQRQLSQQQGQIAEIGQAMAVAGRAADTAKDMLRELDSAESWSTYDVWFKGGLISHAAKYDHLDTVGALNGQLSAQLRDLRRELADINLSVEISLNEYSGGTRVLDFFFDNIFTDLSVRDRVRDDMSSVETIIGKLRQLESELNRRLLSVQTEIRQLDRQLEKLLLALPVVVIPQP